jgi:hypothetical protein
MAEVVIYRGAHSHAESVAAHLAARGIEATVVLEPTPPNVRRTSVTFTCVVTVDAGEREQAVEALRDLSRQQAERSLAITQGFTRAVATGALGPLVYWLVTRTVPQANRLFSLKAALIVWIVGVVLVARSQRKAAV